MKAFLCMAAIIIVLIGCNGRDTQSNITAPGADKSAKTKVLEAGAAALQTQPPIGALNAYLDGFHFYNGDMKMQMEAHHYCAILNDDLIQCYL